MENLDLDELTRIIGGKYSLVSLMQKRLRELQLGHPPLIENTEALAMFEIVAEEIRQKKIWLVTGEEADKLRKARLTADAPQITQTAPAAPAAPTAPAAPDAAS